MLRQELDLKKYVGIDLDADSILWNKENLPDDMEFIEGNFFAEDIYNKLTDIFFDAIVSMDVLEHINPSLEDRFCEIITKRLKENGVAVIGTPNIMMSPYACEESKIGHINLYNQDRLYQLLAKYFHDVFIFNMNDEIVNMGFAPMACYIIAVCCNKKDSINGGLR